MKQRHSTTEKLATRKIVTRTNKKATRILALLRGVNEDQYLVSIRPP